jgi:hypothetical protein
VASAKATEVAESDFSHAAFPPIANGNSERHGSRSSSARAATQVATAGPTTGLHFYGGAAVVLMKVNPDYLVVGLLAEFL